MARLQSLDLGEGHDLARLSGGDLVEALAERPEQAADPLAADALAFAHRARPEAAERELAGMRLVQDLEAFGHDDAVARQRAAFRRDACDGRIVAQRLDRK